MIVDALVYLDSSAPGCPRVFTTWNEGELTGPNDPIINRTVSDCLTELDLDVTSVRLVRLQLPDGPLLAELRAAPQTVPGSVVRPGAGDLSASAVAPAPEPVSPRDGWPYRWDVAPEVRDQSRRLRYVGEDGWGGYTLGDEYRVVAHLDRFDGVTTTTPANHSYSSVAAFWRTWESV